MKLIIPKKPWFGGNKHIGGTIQGAFHIDHTRISTHKYVYVCMYIYIYIHIHWGMGVLKYPFKTDPAIETSYSNPASDLQNAPEVVGTQIPLGSLHRYRVKATKTMMFVLNPANLSPYECKNFNPY